MVNASFGLGEAALSSGFKQAPEFKFQAPPIAKENVHSQKNPNMEGRATPLKVNPAETHLEEGLRKAIQSEDDAMTRRLLEAAGIKDPKGQDIEVNIPKEAKKSQGFWAKILDWFKNFFK